MAGVSWTDSTFEAAGTKLHLSRAGKGRPLLVLHHDTGTLDRLPFYDALAAQLRRARAAPSRLSAGRSGRTGCARVRDIAVIYRGLLADLKRREARRWSASASAAGSRPRWRRMAPRDVSQLVLVGAMGIKPPEGDILDQAIISYIDYARAGFHDQTAFDRVYGDEPSTDQLEQWDICREMSFRIAWKPYMYSQTLPHLLGGVRAPALVVWGDDDQVVPQQRRRASMPRRCPTRGSRSSRPAAIASTWSSPRRWPSWSRRLHRANGLDEPQGGGSPCI